MKYLLITMIFVLLILAFYIPYFWMITSIVVSLILIEIYCNRKSEKILM